MVKAYKRAALRTHPDKAPEGEREAYEERFKRVSKAYEVRVAHVLCFFQTLGL